MSRAGDAETTAPNAAAVPVENARKEDEVTHRPRDDEFVAEGTPTPNSEGQHPDDVSDEKCEDIDGLFTGDLSELISNTPTRASSKADVWREMRRLPASRSKEFPRKTHVCVALNADGQPCRAMIRLSKQPRGANGSTSADAGSGRLWQTNVANTHMRKYHSTSSKSGEASCKRKLLEEQRKESSMFMQGMNQTASKSSASDMRRYALSRDERALTSQARWYIYSKMHISKQEFESPEFREMLREQAGGAVVHLSQGQLKEYVRAEFRIFVRFLPFIISEKMVHAKGNAFAQGIHDGGTLTNHQKYQALGIQFIPTLSDVNFVVCVGLQRSLSSTNTIVAELFKDVCLERTGYALTDLVGNAISDRAAKGVQGTLGLEEEVCMMHDADKLGASAIGSLVRSRQKQIVNPFPEGQRIYKLAHKMGVHFSYGERQAKLYACADGINVAQPKIKIKLDLNGTRVAAQHCLFESELRLNRLLRVYQIKHTPDWKMSEGDWQALAEMEAVLSIS